MQVKARVTYAAALEALRDCCHERKVHRAKQPLKDLALHKYTTPSPLLCYTLHLPAKALRVPWSSPDS